jgi:hypothetical protein
MVNSEFFILFCKELVDVLEGFELEGIAGGVEEEHGRLFAGQAFETYIRFDDEFDGSGFQPAFEVVPFVPVEDDAIVWYGYIVTINGVGVEAFFFGRPWFQVNNELVAIEIEINPLIGATSFFAAEDVPVKSSCFL